MATGSSSFVSTVFFVFFVVVVSCGCIHVQGLQSRVTLVDETSPPYPVIAPAFVDLNATTQGSTSQVWYDSTRQLLRVDSSIGILGEFLNTSTILTSSNAYDVANGVCRPGLPIRFIDFFGWLPQSTYNGQVYVNGVGYCDQWIYKTQDGYYALDTINGNTPVFISFPLLADEPGLPNNTYVQANISFSSMWMPTSYGPNNVSLLEPPASCYEMKVCPTGPVLNETFYVFHSVNDYTLINTNVADETGDLTFVCFALIFDTFTYFDWISEYVIELNTTYGQYSPCNFGTCVGGATDRVGREAAEGFTEGGGQCNVNNVTGSWYSLPVYNQSLCPGGGLGDNTYNETVGINGTSWSGCGWRVVEKVKTIDSKCLEAHGFFNACTTDFALPWPKASQVWRAAFDYEDESQGGCPSINNTTMTSMESSTLLKPLLRSHLSSPSRSAVQRNLSVFNSLTSEDILTATK